MLLWSGVPPAPAAVPADASVSGSLRLMLSLEPKHTRAPERELMSGDVSDSPGRSSALVGVTVKRTDAMAAHLGERGGWTGAREPRARSGEGRWRTSGQGVTGRLLGGAGVGADSRICSLDAAHLHWSRVVGCNHAYNVLKYDWRYELMWNSWNWKILWGSTALQGSVFSCLCLALLMWFLCCLYKYGLDMEK